MTKRAGPGIYMRVIGFTGESLVSPERCWFHLGVVLGFLGEPLFCIVEWRAKEWSTWRAAEPEEARERRDSAGRAEDWRDRTRSAREGSPVARGVGGQA